MPTLRHSLLVSTVLISHFFWFSPSTAEPESNVLALANEALENGQYETAIDLLSGLINSENIGTPLLGQAYYQRGRAYWSQESRDLARTDFDRAIPLIDKPFDALRARARLVYNSDKNQSFADILTIARNWPEDARKLDIQLVGPLIGWLETEGRQDEIFDLSLALVEAEYSGTKTGNIPAFLTIPLSRMLNERGREFDALSVIRKITDFIGLMTLRIDKRMENLWERGEFDAATDPEAALHRNLNSAESRLRTNPTSMEAVTNYVRTLHMLGRPQEAAIFAERVLTTPSEYQGDAEDVFWLANQYIYALEDLNLMEPAFATIEKILSLPIETYPSLVNQMINFSETYLTHGQTEKALEMAQSIDQTYASTYGKYWISAVKACAHSQLKDNDKADEIIAAMLETENENYAAVNRALLCRNRIDDAAALTIRRLNDPNESSDMLLAFQNFLPDPSATDYTRILYQRLMEVRDRQDVMEELAKAGRITDIPILQTYWGRF